MARFFEEPKEGWESQLEQCARKMSSINEHNPTSSNQKGSEVLQTLQNTCEEVLNNPELLHTEKPAP